MGIIVYVFLGYSFYDSSVLFNPHFRMGFFAIWIGYFYISFYGKIQEINLVIDDKK